MRVLALLAAALTLTLAPAAGAAVPANLTSPQMSGGSAVGAVVTTSSGTWSGAPDAYEYRWWRCVPTGTGGCAPSIVATTQTYTLTEQDVGSQVYPAVRAHNASGWSAWKAGSAVTVTAAGQPAAPVVTVRPHVTGEPVVGATLTATPGTWTPAPEEYRYQWGRCVPDPDSSSCTLTEIAGATGSTYVVTADDEGAVVRPKVAARVGSTWSAYAPSDNYVGPIGGGAFPGDEGDEGDWTGEDEGWTEDEGDEGDGGTEGSGSVPAPSVRNTGWGATTRREGAAVVVRPAVRVVCPAAAERCAVTVVAKVGRLTVGRAAISVTAGRAAVLRFRLNATGRRLLRAHRRLTAVVAVSATSGSGKPATLTKRVPVRRPAA